MSRNQIQNILSIRHRLTETASLILLLFLPFHQQASAQEIAINADYASLNEVLIQIAKDYHIQLSFDDELLSNYTISVHETFDSPENAVAYLLQGLPLGYHKNGEVYVIFRVHTPPVIKSHLLSGRIVDIQSGEALPYSHILIGNKGVVTDFSGRFSFASSTDSVFSIRISYLGYFVRDTLLHSGSNHVIELTPSIIGLKEVVIKGSAIERSGQVGEEPGVIRLNHKIAYRLPGNGDNAVFNFLRLQPGILAAGEQSNEMIIWGSYSGHSQVLFDGFTIFGLKNFNDNISFVNPYMAKDIRVLKGGYSAEYGNRVGGIVEISGIEGNKLKPSINLNINNLTVNGMVSIPVKELASITFAYRHTYYNLYDIDDLDVISGRKGSNSSNLVDINVFPDYLFRDLNLKYAGSTRSGDAYYVSLFEGRDKFSYALDQEWHNTKITQDAEEGNRQRGATAFYGKSWQSGHRSNLSLSYSGLNRDIFERQEIIRIPNNQAISNEEIHYQNRVEEVTLKNNNHFFLSEKHRLEAGWGYIYNTILFREDSFETNVTDNKEDAHRLNFFVLDEMMLNPKITLKPGIRIDYPIHLDRLYLQPRLQLTIDLTDRWRISGAWGIYNQFISETSVIDDLGNYHYFWAISGNEDVPVLQSQHFVGGVTFQQDGLTIGMETFYKTTDGIARYLNLKGDKLQTVYQGESRAYGMDLMIKKYFRKHEAWTSYTLSRTEEYYPYFTPDAYADAPQDQRHEIKGAILFNFSPFYCSANYVYGSGFSDRTSFDSSSSERYPYNRLDVAFIYRYTLKNYHIEAGISILNLFNTENIKYSNIIKIPDNQSSSITIHAEAVPFTPTIYLNLSF